MHACWGLLLLAAWRVSRLGNVLIVAQGLFPYLHGGKHWVNVEGVNDLGTNTQTQIVSPFHCHVINKQNIHTPHLKLSLFMC